MADTVHVSFRFRGGEQNIDAPVQLFEKQVMVKDNVHPYNFDYVISPSVNQQEVFEMTAKHVVQSFMEGYNGTIFAYGQSGSGKTFTMMGPESVTEALLKGMEAITAEIQSIYGIIPRTIAYIFEQINQGIQQECITYTLHANYIEIYNEKVNDIMSSPVKKNLKIREFPDVGPTVMGLTHRAISTPQEIFDCISLGTANKQVASTNQNSRSSRSHTLFILDLQQKYLTGSVKNSRINLVDLAGSERISKSGAEGQTLEEAKKINLSLTTLSRCIKALTDPKEKFVPFRESKLTLILKESLGGNSKTSLICTASMQSRHLEETVNTLRFAERAKMIVCKAKSNVQRSSAELEKIIKQLKEEIEGLKQKLIEGGQLVNEEESSNKLQLMELQSEYELYKQNVHKEIEELRVKAAEVDSSQNQDILDLEEENEFLLEQVDEQDQKIKELEKELDKINLEKDSIIQELKEQNEWNKMICEQTNQDCEELEKQINNLKERNQKLLSEKGELEINVETQQKQQVDFEKRLQLKDRQSAQLEQENKQIKSQIEELQSQLRQIQEKLNEKEEECLKKNFEITQQKQQITQLSEQISVLKQSIDQQKQINEDTQKELDNQKLANQQISQDLSSIQNKYNLEKQKTQELEKELSDANQQLQKQERSLCEKLEIQEVLQEKQLAIEKLKVSQDERNQKFTQQIEELNQQLSQEKQNCVDSLQQIKQELGNKNKALQDQLNISKDALEAKQDENTKLLNENQEISLQIAKLKQKIEDLKLEMKNQQQKDQQTWKEKEEQLQKELLTYAQEMEQLTQEHSISLEENKQIAQQACNKIIKLQMDIVSLREESTKKEQIFMFRKTQKLQKQVEKRDTLTQSSQINQKKQNQLEEKISNQNVEVEKLKQVIL